MLTSLSLSTTTSNCGSQYGAGFCPFIAAGVGFTGTARSIGFGGVANQIVFDDITFGSTTPGPAPTPAGAAPEPSTWVLMILGFGAVGFAMRRAVRRSEAKFDARIKRIAAGAVA